MFQEVSKSPRGVPEVPQGVKDRSRGLLQGISEAFQRASCMFQSVLWTFYGLDEVLEESKGCSTVFHGYSSVFNVLRVF